MNQFDETMDNSEQIFQLPLVGAILFLLGGIITFITAIIALFQPINTTDFQIIPSGRTLIGLDGNILFILLALFGFVSIIFAGYRFPILRDRFYTHSFIIKIVGRSSSTVTCVTIGALEIFFLFLVLLDFSIVFGLGLMFLMLGTLFTFLGSLIILYFAKVKG